MSTISEIKKAMSNNRFDKIRLLHEKRGSDFSRAFEEIADNSLNNFKQRQNETTGSNKEILNFVMKEIETLFKELFLQIKSLEVQILKGDKGDMGNKPLAGIDYPIPKDGESSDETKIIKEVLNKIPSPQKGKDGKDADENKIIGKILTRLPKNKEFKLEAEMIRDKLQSLKEEKRLDVSAIKDLIPLIRSYISQIKSGSGRGGGGDTIRYVDLSSQCDGSTKEFTLTRVNRVLGVFGTQFPLGYRPEVDWTFTASSSKLTLTGVVSAPETGQTLWVMYVEG